MEFQDEDEMRLVNKFMEKACGGKMKTHQYVIES